MTDKLQLHQPCSDGPADVGTDLAQIRDRIRRQSQWLATLNHRAAQLGRDIELHQQAKTRNRRR